MNELVFVYGTLRQGASNAWRMSAASFVAPAIAKGELYRVDWYPAAIFQETSPHSIVGEIYQLSAEHLQELDAFEGAEYRRIPIIVTTTTQQQQVWVWEYQLPIDSFAPIPSGDWLSLTDHK